MKIGIIHFTDLHFTVNTKIEDKQTSCLNIINNDLYGVDGIYFVISGDIAYSGKKEEYDSAAKFFNILKQLIEKQYSLKVKMIIVPGNHDCDFARDTQLRRNSINNMNYSYLGNDNSVIDTCLPVQDQFWEFYKNYNSIPDDKLFYQITDKIGEISICFNCINTSWMSQIHENVGSLFFPVNRYNESNVESYNVNIGVLHHPYNWFNPNTAENNKKELERFAERIASVHFMGHEHENEFYNKENMLSGDKVQLLSGKVFNDDKHVTTSGFQTVIVNLESSEGGLKIYEWNKTLYSLNKESELEFKRGTVRKFEIKPDFLKKIDEIKIPLTIGDRKNIRLSEIFIFPDLDSMGSEVKILDNYKDSAGLLSDAFGHSIICGDDQIGKTSLLNIIYLKKYNENIYPLLINAKDIKELNLEKVLRKGFKQQYTTENDFDSFLQLKSSKRILLIDDYHHCNFSASNFYSFLKEAMTKFSKVLLTIDSEHSMLPIIQTEFSDINFYKIKPLGYSKRNNLIEQYYYLKSLVYNNQQDSFMDIKESFDKVSSVLGDKLIPSYPIYILSILQALDYNSLKQNETSFGYCYQTLIHLALHNAGVKNDDMDTYFNFLIEIAYEFIEKDKEVLSEEEILTFFVEYKKRYISPGYDIMIKVLKDSKILIFNDDEIFFGYDYILYYLSAKKIADIINTIDGKKIINKLFSNLHLEKNGNILVFITHHSKDVGFIEESLLNSMIVLSNFAPITLASDDPFYKHIKEIANEVSKDILELNKNPKKERERQLKMLDEQNAAVSEAHNVIDEISEDDPVITQMNTMMMPFKQAFRAIEIVGQIIRNRKGSLEIPKLKEMIKEVYITGFRTISYSSQLLIAAKNQLIVMLNEDDIADASKSKIEESVNEFVMMSSYEACLGIFTKLSNAMGIKDLKAIFNEVSAELNTPAAKLVSFGINSYYGTISENELKLIVNELKGNPVALKILRARVKSYVYSRNLNIRTKQKFASLLQMTIGPSRPITNKHSK